MSALVESIRFRSLNCDDIEYGQQRAVEVNMGWDKCDVGQPDQVIKVGNRQIMETPKGRGIYSVEFGGRGIECELETHLACTVVEAKVVQNRPVKAESTHRTVLHCPR